MIRLGGVFIFFVATKCVTSCPWQLANMAISSVSRVDKVVHFVRHGVGRHNVASAGCHDFSVFDARLVKQGVEQALALGAELATAGVRADIIITSPMWRTLQTTSYIVDGFDGGRGTQNPGVVVTEDLREHFTACTDSARGKTASAAAAFPSFYFDPLASNRDPMLVGGDGLGQFESFDDLHVRAARVVEALRNRPETHIIVVSHCMFIGAALEQAYLMGWVRVKVPRLPEHVVAKPESGHFGNCQVASLELRSS